MKLEKAVLNRSAETCRRLAATQQNLPVPITPEERKDLRNAARLLRALAQMVEHPETLEDL